MLHHNFFTIWPSLIIRCDGHFFDQSPIKSEKRIKTHNFSLFIEKSA